MGLKALLGSLLLLTLVSSSHADTPITLHVDARESSRSLLHVQEIVPVKPGVVALAYPKWIPGEHAPTGPNIEVAGLIVTANDKRLAWRRDDIDMNVVRVTVPAGVSQLEVRFDFLLTTSTSGYSSAASSTAHLLLLSWNQVVMYPAGAPSDRVSVNASVALPEGWTYGTALHVRDTKGETLFFDTVSLTTLVDSPVLAGEWFRRIDLTPAEGPSYSLDLACDGPEGLRVPDSVIAVYRHLPAEAHAWFGGWHHGPYHFLVTLSDHTAHFGLEHHESSDDRISERALVDDDLRLNESTLLPHELSHSWNGKYRRPAGLATPDYGTPMKGELLWVYEGLTNYSGWLLASRSGLRSTAQGLEDLAHDAAYLEARRGRDWRPLVDTGVEAQSLYDARGQWANARRSVDFYDEGTLIWLDADVTIRRLTKGTKSLDDFCHAFHGGKGGPELKPYTFDDIVRTLNGVVAYDWATFLHTRVDQVQPHAPIGGITDGGYRLAWTDQRSSLQKARESADKLIDESFSLGLNLSDDGTVRDLVPGSPADKAGLAPDMKVIAVNGRRFEKDRFRDAIRATREHPELELLCENGDTFHLYTLQYSGGLRYPSLERTPGTADLLTPLLAPHATR